MMVATWWMTCSLKSCHKGRGLNPAKPCTTRGTQEGVLDPGLAPVPPQHKVGVSDSTSHRVGLVWGGWQGQPGAARSQPPAPDRGPLPCA